AAMNHGRSRPHKGETFYAFDSFGKERKRSAFQWIKTEIRYRFFQTQFEWDSFAILPQKPFYVHITRLYGFRSRLAMFLFVIASGLIGKFSNRLVDAIFLGFEAFRKSLFP